MNIMKIIQIFLLACSLALNVLFGLHFVRTWLEQRADNSNFSSSLTSVNHQQISPPRRNQFDNQKGIANSAEFTDSLAVESVEEPIFNGSNQDEFINSKSLLQIDKSIDIIDEELLWQLLASIQQFLIRDPANVDALMFEIQIYLALNERVEAIQLMLDLTNQQDGFPFLNETINKELAFLAKNRNFNRIIYLGNAWLNQLSENIDLYIHIIEAHLALDNRIDAEFLLNQLTLEQKQYPKILKLFERLEQSAKTTQTLELIPLKKRGEHYVLTAYVAGIPMELIIDTGASITALTESQFDAVFGLVTFQDSRKVSTANGIIVADFYQSPTMRIGTKMHNPFEFSVMHLKKSGPGLLGMNFLSHYQFKIDQITKQLVLEPKNE